MRKASKLFGFDCIAFAFVDKNSRQEICHVGVQYTSRIPIEFRSEKWLASLNMRKNKLGSFEMLISLSTARYM